QAFGRTTVAAPVDFRGNTNETFLGAPFDICVDEAGTVFPNKGGLQNSFNSWKALLVQGNYGWGASQTNFNTNITAVVQDVSGTVTFTTEDAVPVGIVAGQYYPAAVRGFNQS